MLSKQVDQYLERPSGISLHPHEKPSSSSWKPPVEVETWLDSGKLLYIMGELGSGKSTTTKRIVEHLESLPEEYPVILSYFYDGTVSGEDAVFQMVSKFLLQLLEVTPSLIRHFPTQDVFWPSRPSWPELDSPLAHDTPRGLGSDLTTRPPIQTQGSESGNISQAPEAYFSLLELTEVLVSMLQDSDFAYSCIFIIDGVDNIEPWSRVHRGGTGTYEPQISTQLTYLLRCLFTSEHAKVCLSWDRDPLPSLSVDSQQLVLSRDQERQETSMIIMKGIRNFEGTREGTRKLLHDLDDREESMIKSRVWSYLWQTLVATVAVEIWEQERLDELVTFLRDVNVFDDDPVARVCRWVAEAVSERDRLARCVLEFVSLAHGALTLGQLAILIDASVERLELVLPVWSTEISKSRRQAMLSQASTRFYGLLTLRGNRIVFTYPSTKRIFRHCYVGRYQQLNYRIAMACLEIIDRAGGKQNVDYLYAAKHWAKHLKSCYIPSEKLEDTISSIQRAYDNSASFGFLPYRLFPPPKEMRNGKILCILASFDLDGLFEDYLSRVQDYLSVELAIRSAAVNQAEAVLSCLRRSRFWAERQESSLYAFNRFGQRLLFRNSLIPMPSLQRSLGPGSGLFVLDDSTLPLYALDSDMIPFADVCSDTLTLAVRKGDISLAQDILQKQLYAKHIQPSLHGAHGQPSLLHIAAMLGYSDIARLLMEYNAPIRAEDKYKRLPIHWAAERAHDDVVRLLVSSRTDLDSEKRTPLFNACESKSASTIRLLLDVGQNINHADRRGWTPLHVAAYTGAAETVRLLISGGADIRVERARDISPLHLAAYGGWLPAAIELLTAKIPVDIPDKQQQTPLHYACKSPNPTADVVRLLVDAGADTSAEDTKGQMPLHVAAKKGSTEVIQLLLASGASPTTKDHRGRVPLSIARSHKNIQAASLLEQFDIGESTASSTTTALAMYPPRSQFLEQTGSQYDGSCVVFVSGLYPLSGAGWADRSSIATWKLIHWRCEYSILDFLKRSQLRRLATDFLEALHGQLAGKPVENTSTLASTYSQSAPQSIVFVAHGVGGILLKEALNIASVEKPFADILEWTRGIVFLGTPHNPSGLQNTSDIVRDLFESSYSRPRMATGDTISFKRLYVGDSLPALRQNESLLRDIQAEFQTLSVRVMVPILSMCESRPTDNSRIVCIQACRPCCQSPNPPPSLAPFRPTPTFFMCARVCVVDRRI